MYAMVSSNSYARYYFYQQIQAELLQNHKYVDGRLLQTNKKFSALKVKQKEKIAHWMYDAYREQYKKTGRFPTKNDDSEIIDIAYQKIEMDIHVKKKPEASEKINVTKQRGKQKFQEDRRKQLSRKPNKQSMKLIGTSMGAKVASDQMEGGEEVYQAGMIVYEGTAIAKGTVQSGGNLSKKASNFYRKQKLKVVEAKSTTKVATSVANHTRYGAD